MTLPEILKQIERRKETPNSIRKIIKKYKIRGFSAEQEKVLMDYARSVGIVR